jgi:hypothetical protein
LGYTHYFYTKPVIDQRKFNQLVQDVRKIYAYPGVKDFIVADPETGTGDPIASEEGIIEFNGIKEDSHETFQLLRRSAYAPNADEEFAFQFCKTALKPYDVVVTCVLIRAKKVLGNEILVRSDGDWGDWIEGRRLYKEVFNEEPDDPIEYPSEKDIIE